jgi:ribonuclease P protein component
VANKKPNTRKVAILRSKKDFDRIRNQGKVYQPNSWLLANIIYNEGIGLRVGWTLPIYVGNAVVRNRMKRWLREYLRSQEKFKNEFSFDINLVFKRKHIGFYSEKLEHEELNAALEQVFKKIRSAN